MHIKRQLTPKKWPIVKKVTAYIVKPNFNSENGLTILTILRDILKIAQTRKEVKKAIFSKNVLLNSKPLKDEKHSAVLFDTLSIIPAKKSYRLTMSEGGKFKLDEIGERESSKKISKIVDKRIISGKKRQINREVHTLKRKCKSPCLRRETHRQGGDSREYRQKSQDSRIENSRRKDKCFD